MHMIYGELIEREIARKPVLSLKNTNSNKMNQEAEYTIQNQSLIGNINCCSIYMILRKPIFWNMITHKLYDFNRPYQPYSKQIYHQYFYILPHQLSYTCSFFIPIHIVHYFLLSDVSPFWSRGLGLLAPASLCLFLWVLLVFGNRMHCLWRSVRPENREAIIYRVCFVEATFKFEYL